MADLTRRVAKANGMTKPLTPKPPAQPFQSFNIITVSGVVWTVDADKKPICRDEPNAVYKEHSSGRIIVLRDGKWCYKDDGTEMPIRGFLIKMREDAQP